MGDGPYKHYSFPDPVLHNHFLSNIWIFNHKIHPKLFAIELLGDFFRQCIAHVNVLQTNEREISISIITDVNNSCGLVMTGLGHVFDGLSGVQKSTFK